GKPLQVRDPVLEMAYGQPTADWHIEALSNGWFRRSKLASQSDEGERDRFVSEVQIGLNDIVSTFPDGTHRWHSVRSSGSPWHFNMFVDCACRLAADMPQATRDWLLCPKPRRD
ncbi:MAG: hypothetical protein NBV67_16190, partial [Tagaea sp.]|nr:hypothetical protein [Tagaea sp.]